MSDAGIWWVLAGVAIAFELTTGTFYLLMLALGLAVGGLAAHFGLNLSLQMLSAAVIGSGAVALWRWKRSQSPQPLRANANPDVHLDIGDTVNVLTWNIDGTASVHYRGAQWTVIVVDPNVTASPGNFRIKEMRGNRLVVENL